MKNKESILKRIKAAEAELEAAKRELMENKFPTKLEHLEQLDEFYYISYNGNIICSSIEPSHLNTIERKETAQAFVALMQLIRFRDAWWRVDDDWKPEWEDVSCHKYIIAFSKNDIYTDWYVTRNAILAFRTPELRNNFLDTFRDLIEIAKELL